MSPGDISVRSLDDGLTWLQECGPDRREFVEESTLNHEWYRSGEPLHVPQNAYLFSDEQTALFDTLSPACGDSLVDTLEEVLGDRALDYLVLSHPDVPHAGNTPAVLDRYPDVTLLAPQSGTGHELYKLDEARLVTASETLDIGDQTLTFREGTFPDSAIHLWLTESTRNALFTVDWLGFPHMGTECLHCVDEFEALVSTDRLTEFHSRVLFWYQYVDVEKVQREIDALVDAYEPDAVFPAHGAPIRSRAIEHMQRMKPVVSTVATGDFGGRLG